MKFQYWVKFPKFVSITLPIMQSVGMKQHFHLKETVDYLLLFLK
jgi:hypothetical protein